MSLTPDNPGKISRLVGTNCRISKKEREISITKPLRLKLGRINVLTVRIILEYIGARAVIGLSKALPSSWDYSLGVILGLICSLHPRYRKIALRNLKMVYADSISHRELKAIARGSFINLGLSAIECARMSKTGPTNLANQCEIVGLKYFKKANHQRKGIILLTGHLGNWELCASYWGQYVHRLAALVRPQANPLINDMIIRHRQIQGIRVIPHNCPSVIIRLFFNNNFSVGFVFDQYGGQKGVKVEFFGRKTSVPKGPIIYALRLGIPIIPIFAVRIPGNPIRHRIFIEPELYIERTGDIQNDIKTNTQKAIRVLESYILRYPDQWLWMYRRWKEIRR